MVDATNYPHYLAHTPFVTRIINDIIPDPDECVASARRRLAANLRVIFTIYVLTDYTYNNTILRSGSMNKVPVNH